MCLTHEPHALHMEAQRCQLDEALLTLQLNPMTRHRHIHVPVFPHGVKLTLPCRPGSKLAPLGAKPTLAPLGGGSLQRKTPDQVAQELKQQAGTTS